jgi:hypothetical protein
MKLSTRSIRAALALLAGCVSLAAPARAADTSTGNYLFSSYQPRVVGAYVSLGYWDLSQVDPAMDELAASGVNLIIDYALTPPEDESWLPAMERYLLTAEDHGIKVAFPLFPLLEGHSPDSSQSKLREVVQVVSQLKQWPQIGAWYVHDEVLPSLQGVDGTMKYGISLEDMRELYRLIRMEDPTRPQINVWCSLPHFENFGNMFGPECTPCGRPGWMGDQVMYEQALQSMVQDTCDWVMVDSYPIGAPWRRDAETSPVQDVSNLVARAAALKRPDQPLIFVFQSFSWAQYDKGHPSEAPFPSTAEMYSMLFSAWEAGARGAVAYSWFDLADDDLPGSRVKGRDQCLRSLKRMLENVSDPAWPNCEAPF